MPAFRLVRFFLLGILLSGLLFSIQSCGDKDPSGNLLTAHQYDYKVYWEWNETFLHVDRYAKAYRPGPVSRALAYLGLSAYECVVSAIPENRSIASAMPGLSVPEADPDLEAYFADRDVQAYIERGDRRRAHPHRRYSRDSGGLPLSPPRP